MKHSAYEMLHIHHILHSLYIIYSEIWKQSSAQYTNNMWKLNGQYTNNMWSLMAYEAFNKKVLGEAMLLVAAVTSVCVLCPGIVQYAGGG